MVSGHAEVIERTWTLCLKSLHFTLFSIVVLFLKGKICIRLLLLLARYHGENGFLIGKGNEKRKREKGKL